MYFLNAVDQSATGIRAKVLLGMLVLMVGSSILKGDEADAFFDDSRVHEIRLTFDDADWYTTLYNSHANDVEDPYFPAAFEGDGVSIDKIGVRFKGNSSFRVNSIKKSIKLDFDEYDEENDELSFFGLKKLNLNNSFKDPTMLREKLILDFGRQYVPTIRAVHTRVYINDEYIGLYVAVEQVDKNFIEANFGSDEDGNLYKGAASDDVTGGPQSDFGSDLVWEGSEESAYYDHYQLKTNEEANDYSGLVSFIDVLNNGDPASFPEELEPLLDVDNALASIAINSLFMNLDSYNGSAHNYYVYQSDTDGQFSHIFWDMNEAFGSFLRFWSGSDPLETDPFWHPTTESRPLMEQLWENEDYAQRYLAYHARMLREGFDVETMMARVEELAGIIRTDVYADPNKEYSDANFESNLYNNVGAIYGLETFIEGRVAFLEQALDAYATQSDLKINEVVSLNDGGYLDTSGEAEPWIELYNPGLGEVSLSGLYFTDSELDKTKWALPAQILDDGEYVVFWLDGESSEGVYNANFTADPSGGNLYLYDSAGSLIDRFEYPALEIGNSYQRYPDGGDNVIYSDRSTPAEENQISEEPSVSLFINEILAQNDTVLQDPAGTGFPDWFEIYNPNPYTVDLSGMYLTDNTSIPLQWKIPEGVEIDGEGYLLIWADNDEEQGPTHTNFKLSTEGEELALYDSDINGNVLIDHVVFGQQTADVSYGRDPDGSDSFGLFEVPTPGAGNAGLEILSEGVNYHVGIGATIFLSAEVEGFGTLNYQWLLNGNPIQDATGVSLEIGSIAAEQAGDYALSVSNGHSIVSGDIAYVMVDVLDPNGDSDDDGVDNMLESAFGMNATVPDAYLLPTFTYNDGTVGFSAEVYRDDLYCFVESSDDLNSWSIEQTLTPGAGLWLFSVPVSEGENKFFRMRMSDAN